MQSSYGNNVAGGGGMHGASIPTNNGAGEANAASTLRRRNVVEGNAQHDNNHKSANKLYRQRNVVKNLDFMFPKVDTEYMVQTDRGGIAFVVACVVIVILCLAETVAWRSQNLRTVEHVVVDTSLGQRMQVNLNITFPSIACVDLHVDIMDVAGDSQLDLDQSFITKTRLHANGTAAGEKEQDVGNKHRKQQEDVVKQIQQKPLPDDYCGPCFGAQTRDGQCCNTCDELLAAYENKRWQTNDVLQTSEQCIREGRHTEAVNSGVPKQTHLTLGEGCNLVGHMKLNRVAGNFHMAMGEGIQRNGKHVHIFNPDETPNFNSSHIIHHLSFGGHHDEPFSDTTVAVEEAPLNNVAKIVQEKHGTTGLFQYFIKVVPTTHVTPATSSWFSKPGKEKRRETNGFFFTERFRPLMKEYFEDNDSHRKLTTDKNNDDGTKDDDSPDKEGGKNHVEAQAGHAGKHAHHGHHNVKTNSVLPGVFFIYEIYPFAVEVRPNAVPLTHLLIRLMATIGGVFTLVQFVDGLLENKKKSGQPQHHPQQAQRRTR